MQKLEQTVQRVAPLHDPVFITGERGTGKELLAKALHLLGPTRGGSMVIVDCASLPQTTVESILFGHERGSFTGATRQHIGFLEAAHEGTLFLDEISHLPLEVQRCFLRFLQEGTITRIGANRPKQIRTRIIAASNRPIQNELKQGTFLPDLYDRLNVFPLRLPPLRARENDIHSLMQCFMGKTHFQRVLPEGLQVVLNYPFPGNVRELQHLCRRLVVFHPTGTITKEMIETNLDPISSDHEMESVLY